MKENDLRSALGKRTSDFAHLGKTASQLLAAFQHNHLSLLTESFSQRDVAYLGWPIAPSYMSPNAGGDGTGLSRWLQLCTRSPNKLCRSNSIFNLWDYLIPSNINILFWRTDAYNKYSKPFYMQAKRTIFVFLAMDGCLNRRERVLLFRQIFPQGKFPNNSIFCSWILHIKSSVNILTGKSGKKGEGSTVKVSKRKQNEAKGTI